LEYAHRTAVKIKTETNGWNRRSLCPLTMKVLK